MTGTERTLPVTEESVLTFKRPSGRTIEFQVDADGDLYIETEYGDERCYFYLERAEGERLMELMQSWLKK